MHSSASGLARDTPLGAAPHRKRDNAMYLCVGAGTGLMRSPTPLQRGLGVTTVQLSVANAIHTLTFYTLAN